MHWTIHHKEVTQSTNLDAQKGKPGDVFTADFQTAGRGRLDHKWLSAPGENLMMSAVLDVEGLSPEHISTIPLAVGLSVLRGLERVLRVWFGPNNPNTQTPKYPNTLSLKWPNDILVDGRKLSGILCERHADSVIAGLGVNVLQQSFAPEIAAKATSLAIISIKQSKNQIIKQFPSGSVPSVLEVRDSILEALSEVYETWKSQGFSAIYPDIVAHDYLRGQTLGVIQTDDDTAPIRGLCGGIQPDGSLLVGDTPIYAGEAHILP